MTCMYKHYEIKTKMIGQGGDKNLLGGGGGVTFSRWRGMSKFLAGGETSPTPPPVGKPW